MTRGPDPVKAKGRNYKRRVFAVHHDVVNHPRWAQLSPHAKILWLELGLQYFPASRDWRKPGNNGWLACPYKYLIEERGFRSRSTIKEALKELEWFGFIETTDPGSFPREPARYRLTHLDSDQHPDHNMPALKATHDYRKHDGTLFPKRSRKKLTPTVPLAHSPGPYGGTMEAIKGKPSPARGTRGNVTKLPKSHVQTKG